MSSKLDAARRLSGSPRDAPATPALILDLPTFERNVAEMARRMEPLPVALGAHLHAQPGLRLDGVLGYEGHCMLEADRALHVEQATASNAALVAVADEFERRGLPTEVVAGGGLGTWDITGANPWITEIHAGAYVVSGERIVDVWPILRRYGSESA